MSPPVTLRAARPADADAVVPLMYESARLLNDFCFRFGDHAPEEFLRADFLRGEGLFGHRHQLVAVTGTGDIVATVTVYRGARATWLTLQTLRSALGHFRLRRFAVVLWRTLALATLFTPPQRDGVFIANACVAAARRGAGLMSAMLEHVFRTLGADASAAELDVSFANERAQRLYERHGFVVVGERAYRGRRRLDGFRRMRRALP